MENKNFKIATTIESLNIIKDSWKELMRAVCIADSWLDVKVGEQIEYAWGLSHDLYKKVGLVITDDDTKIVIVLKDGNAVEFENIADFDRYCWESDRIMSKYESERLEAIKNWAAENLVSE